VKVSDFIARTVAGITQGIKEPEDGDDAAAKYHINEDGPGPMGIHFDIPVTAGTAEPEVFIFDPQHQYGEFDPIPRVSFSVRRRDAPVSNADPSLCVRCGHCLEDHHDPDCSIHGCPCQGFVARV